MSFENEDKRDARNTDFAELLKYIFTQIRFVVLNTIPIAPAGRYNLVKVERRLYLRSRTSSQKKHGQAQITCAVFNCSHKSMVMAMGSHSTRQPRINLSWITTSNPKFCHSTTQLLTHNI
jgi:hypothetical protein